MKKLLASLTATAMVEYVACPATNCLVLRPKRGPLAKLPTELNVYLN